MLSPDGVSGEINEVSIAAINIILIGTVGVRVLCWDQLREADVAEVQEKGVNTVQQVVR